MVLFRFKEFFTFVYDFYKRRQNENISKSNFKFSTHLRLRSIFSSIRYTKPIYDSPNANVLNYRH